MIRSVSVKNAVNDALEIFQFDQWIRFYFVKEKDGEAAMGLIVGAIRDLEGRAEILLLANDED